MDCTTAKRDQTKTFTSGKTITFQAISSRNSRKREPKAPLLFPISKQYLMKFAPPRHEPAQKNGQTADGHTGCLSAV